MESFTFPKRIGRVGCGIGVLIPLSVRQVAGLEFGDWVNVTVTRIMPAPPRTEEIAEELATEQKSQSE